jgi:hypothetical protein
MNYVPMFALAALATSALTQTAPSKVSSFRGKQNDVWTLLHCRSGRRTKWDL